MDKVVLYDHQYNSQISYEREREGDPLHTVEEQVLDVNYAIHFLVKEEYRDSQDSPGLEADTYPWIKQETFDKCPDYTENNFYNSVNHFKQDSPDKCRVNNSTCVNSKSVCNSASVDCTAADSKTNVNFNAGVDNFECNLDETNMGIAKSRRNSHNTIDIVETELEYNPSQVFKRSLSPPSNKNAENMVKYSFSPAKNCHVEDEILESCKDRVYSVNMSDTWDSSVGELLTPIRSRVSSVAGTSAAKKLKLSAVKGDAKRRGRPPASSKIAPVKSRGRPSQGKLTSKSSARLSAGKRKEPPAGIVASGNGRSRKSLSKVPETTERKPKVLSRNSSLISKAKTKARLKRSVSIGKLRCSKGPSSTSRHTVLARHELAHSQDLVCRWCGLQCPTMQALGRHSVLHQETKTFVCSLCTFSCQYLWMLHSHRSSAHPEVASSGTHRSGRIFRCQACQYTCHKTCMLKRHMLIHLQLRPYSCKLCPFTCNIKYNLKSHMVRHTRVKPHACKVCGVRFSRSYALTLHSRVHTGEKPHACDRCNFTCAHFSSLKRHRLQHENKLNERLCCPTCDFACKLLVTFLKHRATEHGERGLYSCHLCHASLDNTRQLAKHLWKHKKEGRYGDNEELFRLPKYLVRIRDKVAIKPKRVEAQQKAAKGVLKATSRVSKDASNKSIGELIIKNLSNGNRAVKNVGRAGVVRKAPEEVAAEPELAAGRTERCGEPPSLREVKVVCRRLTISEIIRRRVDRKF